MVRNFLSYVHTPELNNDTKTMLETTGLYPVLRRGTVLNPGKARNHTVFEGDNLHTLLLLQNTHQKNVDVIYIDPPYNTKNNDFNYQDTFTQSNDKHSAWLSLMERRLVLARNLLAEDGYICVSIDNNEAYHLKLLLDSVFGEENFVDGLIWINNKAGRTLSKHISHQYEFILMYAKNKAKLTIEPERVIVDSDDKAFKYEDEISRYMISGNLMNKQHTRFNIHTRPNLAYAIYYNEATGDAICRDEKDETKTGFTEGDKELLDAGYIRILPKFYDTVGYGCYRWSQDKFMREYTYNIVFKKDSDGSFYPYTKRRIEGDVREIKRRSMIDIGGRGASTHLKNIVGKDFPFPKPVALLEHIVSMHPNKNATVLDFFAGSGTTGEAVLNLNALDGGNRQFILGTSGTENDGTNNNIVKDFTLNRLRRVIDNDWVSPQDGTEPHPEDTVTHYTVTTGDRDEFIRGFAEYTQNIQLTLTGNHMWSGENDSVIVVFCDNEDMVELLDDDVHQFVRSEHDRAKQANKKFCFVNGGMESMTEDLGLAPSEEIMVGRDVCTLIDNLKQALCDSATD